jgi:NADPH:quinone reductase
MSFGNGMRHALEAKASQAVAAERAKALRASASSSSKPASARGSPLRMRGRLTGEESGMRAIVVTEHGGPEVLDLQDRPDPSPGPGELLVDAEAIGVNFRDVYEREGKGTHVSETPHPAGVEGAGTVSAVGEGVTRFSAGDRVAWSNAPGSYAERVLVSDEAAVALPDGISSELAGAAILQGTTAHYLANSTYPIQEGDWVIVHAAAGGVGLLLTQIAKRRGGRVIATTSTDEKAALARGAGADETIGYDGFAERARELTGGEGVHAVYDGIGEATFDESLEALRPRGYMVLYGAASGPPPPVEIAVLNAKSLFLTRPTLAHYGQTGDELRERAGELLEWVAAGELDVRVGARYALEDAARAQSDLESRGTTGKLILTP